MSALAIHHTPTISGAWDGPQNKANLKNDGDEAYYRKAFAWQDPDGDPATKAAYKFIHHEVSADGTIGAANTNGCSAGIGILNGGRTGTTIPTGDYEGVWRHLAAHIKDADLEAPELKRMVTFEIPIDRRGYEIRAWGTDLAIEEDGQLRGYAAVFDLMSEPMGGQFKFRERIKRGAFANHLAAGADVRALWQHNPEYVLGRTKNKTLTLLEDIHGLRYLVKPPETQWARDFYVSIQRGDVDQSSFAFEVVREDWTQESGENIRTIYEARLYDVSPVTFPAYIQTTVGTRSIWLEEIDAPEHISGNSRTLAHLRRRLELAEKI